MDKQKRQRRSVVEAEALEQAQKLAREQQGSGRERGNPTVQQIRAQMDEHRVKGQFRYYDELGDELVEYFASAIPWWTNYNDSGTGKVLPKGRIPLLERFAYEWGFSKFSVYDWCEKHPKFARCYAEAMELQKAFIMEGAAAGAIPHGYAIFMLKCNHGMVEPKDDDGNGLSDNVAMKVHGEGQAK